ncbi:MAG: hypothetical protein ACI976_000604 [Aureispira sp.]|jgi:hypothetical protein
MLKLKILPYPLNEVKKINSTDNNFNNNKIFRFPYIESCFEKEDKLVPIPSSKGRIKTLLFVLPKDRKLKSKFNFFPVLRELINKMPNVQFIIIHRGSELNLDPIFKVWLKNHPKVDLKLIKNSKGEEATDADLSIWAQDHFYPLQVISKDKSPTTTYGMIGNIDSNFLFSLERIVSFAPKDNIIPNFKLKQTNLAFEGGNILVGDDFMLVGANDYHPQAYEKCFGIKTIFVKTSIPPPYIEYYTSKDKFLNKFPLPSDIKRQPIFHLDMFLTLVGFNAEKTKYTIVVGQPKLGVENLQDIDHEFYLVLNDWLTQMQASICSCINNLKNSFRDQLEVELDIVSIPLVLTYNDIVDLDTKKREWFWATYNNCLVENIEATHTQKSSKKVWLPSYGSPASDFSKKEMSSNLRADIRQHLRIGYPVIYGNWTYLEKYDQAGKYIWEALGFEVCLLEQSYIPFVRQYGSLNCFTNCIER